MVMDHLTDRMGLEPILFVNVNLTETETDTGTETVRVNEPLVVHANNSIKEING